MYTFNFENLTKKDISNITVFVLVGLIPIKINNLFFELLTKTCDQFDFDKSEFFDESGQYINDVKRLVFSNFVSHFFIQYANYFNLSTSTIDDNEWFGTNHGGILPITTKDLTGETLEEAILHENFLSKKPVKTEESKTEKENVFEDIKEKIDLDDLWNQW